MTSPLSSAASKFKLRTALDTFPPYLPGRKPAPVPGREPYKLASNEHYLAPLPGVLEAAASADPPHYPDAFGIELFTELSERFGVPRSNFIMGTGASEVLNAITLATVDDGDEAIYPWPSFEMYPQVVGMSAGVSIEVPLTPDFRHDLDAMAAAITDRTSLIFLCSPNNPTGPAIRQSELDAFLDRVPGHIVVVLDEAYTEFATDPDIADGLATQAAHPNLVLVRTFSKAHGLAGMRIGYAIAHPDIIMALNKTLIPFGVAQHAQNAALASLRRIDDVLLRVREITRARDGFAGSLRAQGWNVPDAQANFVWLPLGELSGAFEEACADHAISVRNLDDGVRISMGPAAAMQRVLEIAAEFRRDHDLDQ